MSLMTYMTFKRRHRILLTLIAYININCLSIQANGTEGISLPLTLASSYIAFLKKHIRFLEMLDVKARHDDIYLESPNW